MYRTTDYLHEEWKCIIVVVLITFIHSKSSWGILLVQISSLLICLGKSDMHLMLIKFSFLQCPSSVEYDASLGSLLITLQWKLIVSMAMYSIHSPFCTKYELLLNDNESHDLSALCVCVPLTLNETHRITWLVKLKHLWPYKGNRSCVCEEGEHLI